MRRRKLVIQIDKDKCIECGKCKKVCSKVNHPKLCSGCGKCLNVCPVDAMTLIERTKNKSNNNNKTHKTMKRRIFGHIILVLLAVAGFSAIVMFLWNALLPDIFGIVSINFWQACGLLALSRILFGGVTGLMRHLHHEHNAFHHPHNLIREQWKNMTPEQRKIFIDKRKRFGFRHPFDKDNLDWNKYEEAEKEND